MRFGTLCGPRKLPIFWQSIGVSCRTQRRRTLFRNCRKDKESPYHSIVLTGDLESLESLAALNLASLTLDDSGDELREPPKPSLAGTYSDPSSGVKIHIKSDGSIDSNFVRKDLQFWSLITFTPLQISELSWSHGTAEGTYTWYFPLGSSQARCEFKVGMEIEAVSGAKKAIRVTLSAPENSGVDSFGKCYGLGSKSETFDMVAQ